MQNILLTIQPHRSEFFSSRSDCICLVDKKIWRDLPNSTRSKTIKVINSISEGVPFTVLGGKRVRSNPTLVRFRVGRSLRLILSRANDRLTFKLCQREGYERYFKYQK
jgi:hypothetical protein